MTFYENLAPFYDQIFPANDGAIQFLLSHFEAGQTIVDIGAGTGNMANALARKGLNVIAIEPDEKMAEYIMGKTKANALDVSVYIKGMEEIETIKEKIDGMYCIGNTLPHLNNLEEAEVFLKKCAKIMRNGGKLILQLVNFEKVLSSIEDFTFPIIETSSLTFTRNYEQDGNKILFTTSLTAGGKSYINTIPLYPFTREQLNTLLQKAGFEVESVYGNFKKQEYSIQSPALIVVAKK